MEQSPLATKSFVLLCVAMFLGYANQWVLTPVIPLYVHDLGAAIARGSEQKLVLGNIDVHRDWGYAPDHVEALHRILEVDAPDDYVVATGETHTVREFVEMAFRHAGLDWERHVRIDPA